MMNKSTTLVRLEGIDGCGKTSLTKSLVDFYSCKYHTLMFADLGGDNDDQQVSGTSEKVSNLLRILAKDNTLGLDETERQLLWATLSRRRNRYILPALKQTYDLIISDRSIVSNILYASIHAPNLVKVFEEYVLPYETADLLIWIDTPPEVCAQRKEYDSEDPVERLGINFQKKVYLKYTEFFRIPEKNKRRVDGSKGFDEVKEDIISLIDDYFNDL